MEWWQITLISVGAVAVWVMLSALLYRVFFKRFYDIVLSFIVIVVLSPLYLVLTAVGAIAMKGNPFFVQKRPGKRKKLSKNECKKRGVSYGTYGEEKIIKLLKFRTMTNQKDADGNLLPDEMRLNAYGEWLRSTSLDEIPSILNILIGSISIVGPRPLLVKYLPRYNDEQRHRHDVRPGLTGLAQVNGRNAISWEDKFRYDVDYVHRITLWRDIKIIMLTVCKVFKRSGISSETSATMEEFLGNAESEPLISVIITVYNIDKYVEQCIESVINQSYVNLEIIVVDDGSTDSSDKICDECAKRDKRIRVIHKSNEGLVSARKTGLNIATGKYVGYVDGDDWIDSDFYKELCREAVRTDCDMVAAGLSRDFFGKSVAKRNGADVGSYKGSNLDEKRAEFISMRNIYHPGIYTYVWNKLFKRDVLLNYQNNVPNEITIGEDAAVVFPIIAHCNSITITDNCSYHYRQHEQSMIKKTDWSKSNKKRLQALVGYLNLNVGSYTDKVNDFLLHLFLVHSGSRMGDKFVFDRDLKDKTLALYSGGTFGQYIMDGRLSCGLNITTWIDEDSEECRACGFDVSDVMSISDSDFDYILIASTDSVLSEKIKADLINIGVRDDKILYYGFSDEFKKEIFVSYLKYYGINING